MIKTIQIKIRNVNKKVRGTKVALKRATFGLIGMFARLCEQFLTNKRRIFLASVWRDMN